jgi:hypothetical protein
LSKIGVVKIILKNINVSAYNYYIHEMFWTHWNLSALRSFYGLAASGSESAKVPMNFEVKTSLLFLIETFKLTIVNAE